MSGQIVKRSVGRGLLMLGALLGCGWWGQQAAAQEAAAPAATAPKADFVPYTDSIPGTTLKFDMVPVAGGKFLMGSPESEEGRQENEGPQVEVEVSPFWMGVCEVSWDEYDIFCFSYDIKMAKEAKAAGKPIALTAGDEKAAAVTRPTPPYTDMTFGYGHNGNPAICMTHLAAENYCQWLSAKTGKHYRLPTEAEWEFACRNGKPGPFSFGDASKLGEYAWYADNSNEKPHPIGKKKATANGLHDIYGNISEWCADKYSPDYFKIIKEKKMFKNPVLKTDDTDWYVVRGGSWRDDASLSRAAVRYGAEDDWSIQDPQIPKSIWWHTDAHWAGFRIVRSLEPHEMQSK